MNEKWKKIITACLITIAIEMTAAIVILFPYYKVQRIFDSIDAGRWDKTQEYFEKLSDNSKEKTLSYMDAYGAYICHKYAEGEIDYAHVAGSFDAINSIETTGEVYKKYMPTLEKNEFKVAINNLYKANISYDKENEFAYKNQISDMAKRMDNAIREQAMIEILNEKYDSFIKQEMTFEQYVGFNALVADIASDKVKNYVGVMNENALYVVTYRNKYAEAEANMEEKKYIAVMNICESYIVPEYDEDYSEKYETIYNEAYELGKTYYHDMLVKYLEDKKKETALKLMDKIRAHYGDDFDLEFAKEMLMDEWQVAAVQFVKTVNTQLEEDLAKSDNGKDILDKYYDRVKPDSIALYDINHDDNQEIILFNSAMSDSNYITGFIYAFDGRSYNYVGYSNIMNFSDDNYIIAFPDAYGRETGDECQLVEFDGKKLSVLKVCQDMGDRYIVDGSEVDNVNFLSAQAQVLQYQNIDTLGNIKCSKLEDAESFVATFE